MRIAMDFKNYFFRVLLPISIAYTVMAFLVTDGVEGTLTPRAPNFPYFERPNYRYPYYDQNGRGKLLYGYGGPELYQYKSYSPLEGIH